MCQMSCRILTQPYCTYIFIIFGRLLTLPNDTRARHKMTSSGRTEAMKIHPVHLRLVQSIVVRMGHLAEICETLKQEGLPPNEVRLFIC